MRKKEIEDRPFIQWKRVFRFLSFFEAIFKAARRELASRVTH
jgi:hypothetical protein